MLGSGLIIDGGGCRGVYSAGVLDGFIEENIDFNYVMGVSIGAYNGASYVSKQKKRTFDIYKTYHQDKRFLDIKRLLKNKPIMNTDFVFEDINKRLSPFDYKKMFDSNTEFISVATDVEMGEPVFLHKSQLSPNELDTAIKASCSLPFLTEGVVFNDKKLLDGGISLRLPLKKAFEDGNKKLVVILHTPKDSCSKDFISGPLSSVWYSRYPKLKQMLYSRTSQYNQEMENLKKLEEQGKVYIIAPPKMEIPLVSHDEEMYDKYYHMGIKQVKKEKEKLLKFLLS